MTKRNAWKVEPELIDRFLEVLADNGFKWSTGHRANELKSWCDGDVVLFIEDDSDDSDEELNITEVTEELLKHMENEGVVRMRGEGAWKN